jgi:N-acetylglucosaminyldiphosphoundecaprenol N-acetyl-beta-D-mannosaminyltransferase
MIRSSRANVVWVGLGAPKQELWMHRMHPHLSGISLVGIGAVFDWFAGNVTKAPDWMQRAGLEWLYRLSREPKRLWRRYIYNNPAYLVLLGRQLVSHRLRREST